MDICRAVPRALPDFSPLSQPPIPKPLPLTPNPENQGFQVGSKLSGGYRRFGGRWEEGKGSHSDKPLVIVCVVHRLPYAFDTYLV